MKCAKKDSIDLQVVFYMSGIINIGEEFGDSEYSI